MSEIVVHAEGLSKRYRIGAVRPTYRTLRDALPQAFSASVRRLGRLVAERPEVSDGPDMIWALRDVTFELARGEVLGVIGRNGAGKSTLLKVLSRITKPTSGWAEVRGRVGSLLEVGTGFHPELTGRENIFLNGAILGMKRVEIARNLDEIVAFAGVERFLDTPIKHYSSGMFVRLAFAVAAHLEQEILVIDEVLAVGDASFQRKCLRRMSELQAAGRAMLFVSHDLNALLGVSGRVLWLDGGQPRFLGLPTDTVEQYREFVASCDAQAATRAGEHSDSGPDKSTPVSISKVDLLTTDGNTSSVFVTGEPLRVVLHYRTNQRLERPTIGVGIERVDGLICCACTTEADGIDVRCLEGAGAVELVFDELNLLPNRYRVTVGVWDSKTRAPLDVLLDAAFFQVQSDKSEEGAFHLRHKWHLPPSAGSGPR